MEAAILLYDVIKYVGVRRKASAICYCHVISPFSSPSIYKKKNSIPISRVLDSSLSSHVLVLFFLYIFLSRVAYKWRRCSKKKCCKQCGQVKFMGTMTKWPVQKHTEHHKTRGKQGRNRHKEITIFWTFFLWTSPPFILGSFLYITVNATSYTHPVEIYPRISKKYCYIN